MERTTTVTAADEELSAEAERLAATGVDPDVVEDLAALEDSTVADAGRVLAAVVVDYDDPDTTPATAREAVLDRAGVDPDRLTATAEAVLSGATDRNSVTETGPRGRQAVVVVELAGGHVFAERLPVPGAVPQGPGGDPPSVRRARAFFDYHGGVETLPQLEGEYVDVTRSETGWRVAVPDDRETDAGDRHLAWGGLTVGATVALVVTGVGLLASGSLGPFAAVATLALAGAVALDWLQFAGERRAEGERP